MTTLKFLSFYYHTEVEGTQTTSAVKRHMMVA